MNIQLGAEPNKSFKKKSTNFKLKKSKINLKKSFINKIRKTNIANKVKGKVYKEIVRTSFINGVIRSSVYPEGVKK